MNHITALLLATATLCSGAFVRPPYIGDRFELLILHNNDMHARFEQTSQLSGACTAEDREAGKCYGGFPRVATVVKEAREAAKNGQGPPVLYLNAGDTYTGTAWFTIYKWKIAAEFINALQPDAVSLGNNEVDKESTALPPFLNEINTQILACNVLLKSATNNEKFQKSIIFDINGVKVGIVGYLTPNVLDETDKIEYINEVIAVKEEVDNLKAQNVNIIIALGHSKSDIDLEIAKEVDGLDLIIAGQKNVFNWDGTTKGYATTEEPKIVIQNSGKQVPIVSSSTYNKYLGRMLIDFDTEGEIIEFDAKPITLDSSVPQDEEALQLIKSHYTEIQERSTEVVGSTAVVLDGSACKTEECNLGNFIADAINYYHALNFEGDRWTDASITIIPSAAITGSIAPSNRPANVTRGDLLSVLSQESSLVAVTMSGIVLNQVLEHSVANYDSNGTTGQLLQFSGVRAIYDLCKEPGSRLEEVVVRCYACNVPDFYVVDDDRTYKVIMPAALAEGEYGYTMLVGLEKEILDYDEVTAAVHYMRVKSPVYPEIADRIVIHGSVNTPTDTSPDIPPDVSPDVTPVTTPPPTSSSTSKFSFMSFYIAVFWVTFIFFCK